MKSASSRFAIVKRSGLIVGEMMEQLTVEYDRTKANRGNQNANYAVTWKAIEATDEQLAHLVRTQELFIVQSAVVEGARERAAGVDFIPPEDGATIRSPKCTDGMHEFTNDNGEIELKELKFMDPPTPFVSIVYILVC